MIKVFMRYMLLVLLLAIWSVIKKKKKKGCNFKCNKVHNDVLVIIKKISNKADI